MVVTGKEMAVWPSFILGIIVGGIITIGVTLSINNTSSINVIDCGATINDTIDDTDAFILAIDIMASENKGGNIIVPPGIYIINTHLSGFEERGTSSRDKNR